MNQKLWPIAVFIACWGAVLYGMFIPQPSSSVMEHGLDKVVHLMAFIAMTLTARLVMPRLSLFWFVPLMLVFACGLEYLQPMVRPSRDFGLDDMAANVFGVLIGCVIWPWIWRKGQPVWRK